MMKTLDLDMLSTISGATRPGPNGEGCTGPFCPTAPRPRPFPPRPRPGTLPPILGGDTQTTEQ